MFLTGGFSHRNNCWRGHTAGHRQTRRIMEGFGENVLTEVTEELMKGGSLLDLIVTEKEK